MKKALVLGGARSGKSTYAEKMAVESAKPRLYIATATRCDEEMEARIDHHINRRDASWHTIEEQIEVASILTDTRWREHVILVDCLTLWMTNVLFKDGENTEKRRQELCDAVQASDATVKPAMHIMKKFLRPRTPASQPDKGRTMPLATR